MSVIGLDDDVIATLHAQTAKMPPGLSQLFMIQQGGAVARVAEDATAFGGRAAPFQTLFIGCWQDDAQRSACVEWSRSLWSALKPHSLGAYVNLAGDLDEATIKTTYGADKYARLQNIKAKYDPDNVFHLNQNIEPAQ